MWSLSNAYEEKFGFYVDADGEVLTFDSFVRSCATNEKYYIFTQNRMVDALFICSFVIYRLF